MKKTKVLSLLLAVFLLLSSLTLPLLAVDAETAEDPEQTQSDGADAAAADDSVPEDQLLSSRTSFSVAAKAALLVDLNTGRTVYEQVADERIYPASLTKIMTCLLALENGNLSDVVTVSASALEDLDIDSSVAGLQVGEQMTLENLLYCMMVVSGNDACNVIAEHIAGSITDFVRMMNQRAYELGCLNTHFSNPHGLHDENHYTTAREMATITEYALTMPYFTDVTSQTYYTQPPTNMTSEERTVTTTNRMLLSYDDEYYTYATGVKTGSLNESGYCISATATYDGYSYLVVCMGSPYIDSEGNHIDYHGEMYDAATLFRWAFLNIENKTLVTDGELLGEVNLKYAWDKDRLQVLAQGNLTATLPSSLESGAITTKLDLPESVKAPIKKGDYVGTATFYYNGAELSTVALVAAESVERSEIVQVLQQGQEVLTSTWFIVTATILLVLAAAYAILAILMNRKNKKVRRVKKYRDL